MERENLSAALAPGADCLTLEQLGLYADGALTGAEGTAAAAHIRTCVNCGAELLLLHRVTSTPVSARESAIVDEGVLALAHRAAADARAAEATQKSSTRLFRWTIPALAALMAVLLLIVVVDRLNIRGGAAPPLPASVKADDDALRSQAVSARAPLGDQYEPPQRLEWIAVPHASRYRARLMEVDRHELWSASTTATQIDLPSEVRALSVPSKTLLWEVTAFDASGRQIAESGAQAFRLVPR